MSQAGRYFFGIETVTGDVGGPVKPDNNENLNLIGTAGLVSVTGLPLINSLQIDLNGAIAAQYDCDVGTAIPVAHILNINGAHGINTLGALDVVTVALNNTITLGDLAPVVGDSLTITTGNETITAGNLNVTAGDIHVTGSIAVSTLTDHGILIGHGAGNVTSSTLTNGQLLIGKTGAFDPVAASLTSAGATITITPGAGSINLETGGMVATSFPTDAGIAIPALGALTVAGGTNIGSTGAGSTVTLNLDSALTAIASITGSNGASFQTGTTAGNTLLLRAYNNTTSLYNTFATLTANLVPTFDLNTLTTINNSYIYRVGGTDVAVTDGGTGVSALAAYSVICGGTTTTNPAQSVASLGLAGQVLTSNGAAALPTWQPVAVPFTWAVTTVNAGIVVGNGYIANKAGLLTMTLPATAAIGDIIEISNMNTAVGWRIAQNALQYIRFGSTITSVGIGGYLEATQLGDSAKLVCNVAGASTGWIIVSSIGNLTVV